MRPQTRVRPEAKKLLEAVGCTEPPVDVEKIARHLAVRVVEDQLEDGVSGMLYRDARSSLILINVDDAPVRKRFSIAHEIGHFVLHTQSVFVDRRIRHRDGTSSLGLNREEIQANQFAAELLMPSSLVVREVYTRRQRRIPPSDEDLIRELAEVFEVSKQAIELRLGNLGLLGTL